MSSSPTCPYVPPLSRPSLTSQLSHIYERFCEDVALTAGTAIGYSCGDNLRLLEDLAILKPTFFVSVPRVLNRIYQSVKASTVDAPGFKGTLTRKAFADKCVETHDAERD